MKASPGQSILRPTAIPAPVTTRCGRSSKMTQATSRSSSMKATRSSSGRASKNMKHIAPLVLLALLACSDGGQDEPEDAESNCDPLRFETGAPIELGTVLAAGRDSVGAVYVVDEIE